MGDSFVVEMDPTRGDSIKRKKLTFSEKFSIYFREYCDATGFHGFRYVAESRSIFEKILWTIAIILSLSACTMYIIDAYVKWEQSPVVVIFANKETSVQNIPFPAMTICSESKIRSNITNLKELFMRKKNGENLTRKEEKYLGYYVPMCGLDTMANLSQYEQFLNFDDIFDIIEETRPRFEIDEVEDLLVTYGEYVMPIITEEGFCYTFNLLDRNTMYRDNVVHYQKHHTLEDTNISSKWDITNGYHDNLAWDSLEVYPVRSLLSRQITFNLKIPNEDVNKVCRESVGFRITFHSPTKIPRPSLDYVPLLFDTVATASIKPKIMKTSESLRNYDPEKRGCYFPDEKYLKYFKIYNSDNCNLECLTNATLDECECVQFYMPRENGTRICSAPDGECTTTINSIIRLFESLYPACNCLPMCSDIDYEVTLSQAQWAWKGNHFLDDNSNETLDSYHLNKITIQFVSDTFIATERNELYGLTDLIANFGGLIGLFTGFSVLSLLEIIYFLSVRLFCNVRMFNNWAGHPT